MPSSENGVSQAVTALGGRKACATAIRSLSMQTATEATNNKFWLAATRAANR
jgi:hypothetical protein